MTGGVAFRDAFGVVNVNDPQFGAVGDGRADDTRALQQALNFCFETNGRPNGGERYHSNRQLYIPPGNYRITEPLALVGIMGARIYGAGRFTTRIFNSRPGSSVFVTNGCQYSHFSAFALDAEGGGSICFDLDYDGRGIHHVALQSNTFQDIHFGRADIGIRIGAGGFMGSENLFLNCFWSNHAVAGLSTLNFNALQQSVIGGNFQGCGTGISIGAGSSPVIHGVGFQQSRELDIAVYGGAFDCYSIAGCRTESRNFCRIGGMSATISACCSTGEAEGVFADLAESTATVLNCNSRAGLIRIGGEARVGIQECQFGRRDWLDTRRLDPTGHVEIQNVRYGGTRESGGGTILPRRRITQSGSFDYLVRPTS